MAAPEAAGEIVGMERVSDTTTAAETAPNADPTLVIKLVWMTSMYSTVQNAVCSVDYGHLNSFDLARESKTF